MSMVMMRPEEGINAGRVGCVDTRWKGEGAERLTFLPAKYPDKVRDVL